MTGAVAVIGGSGLYQMEGLSRVKEHEVDTPFGKPSDAIVSGRLGGAEVLFLARHGGKHSILPGDINYRANICALKKLGAKWCVSINAVGSLKEELAPGTLVVPEQLIDKTFKRENTFFEKGIAAHVSFADPYCPVLREALISTARDVCRDLGIKVFSTGTYICIEGPAFSTRAESYLHRSWGADVIGMTALPEARLAREAQIAYATLACVTDYDCWRPHEDVDIGSVLEILKSNVITAQRIITALAPALLELEPSKTVESALRGAVLTKRADIPPAVAARLGFLLGDVE